MFANLLTTLRKLHRRPRHQRRRNSPRGQWQIQSLEPRLLLSTISGRVWLDSNINGIQDAAINGMTSSYEDGIAAITVLLYNSTNTQVGSQTTDANGEFSFTDLSAEDYYLKYQTSILVDNTHMQLTFQDALYGGVNLETMDSDAQTITGETYHQENRTKWIQLDGTNTVDDQAAGYAPIFDLTSLTSAVIGQQYNFSVNLSLPDYLNNPEATIDFFSHDSSVNAITITPPSYHRSQGDLNITFDYTYDTNNFFDTQFKRDLMQYAASTIANQFGDTLAAITTTSSNEYNQTFFAPNSSSNTETVHTGTSLSTNEILIYLGSVNENSSTLGTGGPGGHNYIGLPNPTSQTFVDTVYARGQAGALTVTDANKTDFSIWGGAISFNGTPITGGGSELNWYYGLDTPSGSSNQVDFLSVAMHEMMHLMGFGSAATWDNNTTSGQFTGAATTTYLGTNPLPSTGNSHFVEGTKDPYSNLETAMDPTLQTGTRKYPTGLDNAVMDDLGWDLLPTPVISTNGTVESSHIYDALGTNTITLTIITANGNLTYQIEVDVIDALQVLNDVQINAAGYDDGEVATDYYSQSKQRSVLQSIVVTFTRAVTNFTADDVELKLINQDGSTDTEYLGNDKATFTSDDQITWTIDLRNVRLDNSVYQLLINVNDSSVTDTLTGVALDGDKDGVAGGSYASPTFHQLGGDFNGDGQFSQYDLSALAHYWNGYNPNPPSYININPDEDSFVNTSDTLYFAQWMERLDLTVQEVVVAQAVIPTAMPPSTSSNTLAAALVAYENKQASLTVVPSDTGNADAVTYEDIIGQWLG
jgi:hypothetical protein